MLTSAAAVVPASARHAPPLKTAGGFLVAKRLRLIQFFQNRLQRVGWSSFCCAQASVCSSRRAPWVVEWIPDGTGIHKRDPHRDVLHHHAIKMGVDG